MMKDREIILRVRGMLANHAISEVWSKARELIDEFGVNGAEDYLLAQLQFVRDVRKAKLTNGGDDFGDEL